MPSMRNVPSPTALVTSADRESADARRRQIGSETGAAVFIENAVVSLSKAVMENPVERFRRDPVPVSTTSHSFDTFRL